MQIRPRLLALIASALLGCDRTMPVVRDGDNPTIDSTCEDPSDSSDCPSPPTTSLPEGITRLVSESFVCGRAPACSLSYHSRTTVDLQGAVIAQSECGSDGQVSERSGALSTEDVADIRAALTSIRVAGPTPSDGEDGPTWTLNVLASDGEHAYAAVYHCGEPLLEVTGYDQLLETLNRLTSGL